MKKQSLVLVLVVLLVGMLTIPASAVAPDMTCESETVWVDGYGEVEVETVTTVYGSVMRSTTKTASKTKNYKADGTVIATVTLKTTFGYDGTEAWVNSTDVTKSTSLGWAYKGQSIDKDGGTVVLTAEVYKLLEGTIPVEITMTCSPSGTIS